MLFDVFQQYPVAMPILATVGGLIIGSFLNVVIWRYPIMLRQQMAEFHGEMPSAQSKISLALPRSHCPHCQQTIRVRDNIPLLSWLMLKGRCRDCQAKISKRYPLVELLTALAFLLASLVWPESGWALAVMILSAWLIAASIIDREHHRPRSPMAARCFYSGRIVDGTNCGMGAAEPAHATRCSHRRPGGVYHFLLSALDSRNSSA